MKHLVLCAVLSFGASACSCTDEGAGSAEQSEATVAGTVLDRATGAPVANARVRFDGAEESTDERGRFVLAGLAVGSSGELVASADGGREGRVPLRPLGRRQLEVVVYIGR